MKAENVLLRYIEENAERIKKLVEEEVYEEVDIETMKEAIESSITEVDENVLKAELYENAEEIYFVVKNNKIKAYMEVINKEYETDLDCAIADIIIDYLQIN